MRTFVERSVLSAEFTRAADRTDGNANVIGDVTVLLLNCGHTSLGAPHVAYRPGDRVKCRKCRILTSSGEEAS